MEEDNNKESIDEHKPSHESTANRNESNDANANIEKDVRTQQYDEEGGQRKRRDTHGDPFGDEENAQVKYRTMTWWQAAVTMIAETISLGILSLPSVLATAAMLGGLIILIGL